MDDSEFEALVQGALEALPEEFMKLMDNVNVVIAEWPTEHQSRVLRKSGKNLLLGLYEGIPKTRRGSYGVGGAIPDIITIFKYPILMVSKDRFDVEEKIKDTVMHEIGHHFGLSDEDIENVMKKI